MQKLESRVAEAVKHFWRVRQEQESRQGSATGRRDYGNRSAVTGGAQLGGFAELVRQLLTESGLSDIHIHRSRTKAVLPGYFRPTKDWDLVVVAESQLVASIEFKSQVGPSFVNNFNNRVEEALGSAKDLWTAYREGAFKLSQRPWLGYLMLLEQHPKSVRGVRVDEPHFKVFDEFRDASYSKRYQLFCERLVREGLYDSACFLLTDRKSGLKGKYSEPNPELSFKNFAISLTSRATAIAKTLS